MGRTGLRVGRHAAEGGGPGAAVGRRGRSVGAGRRRVPPRRGAEQGRAGVAGPWAHYSPMRWRFEFILNSNSK
jgi:hypothetical protein